MINKNNQINIGKVENKKILDFGISIKSIFTEDCLECKNKSFLWDSQVCNGCIYNQVIPGNMKKFRKIYPEYRGKIR